MEFITIPILLTMAIVPPVVFMIYIYFKDKAEKEPLWLLALLFFGGMLTVIPDIIFEIVPELILVQFLDTNSIVYRVIDNFFVIALTEEFFKYLVMFLCTWFSKHFNYRFDGIVYAVFASLGMATLENVLYVLQHGFINAIMRSVLSIPGHTFFGVFMGYYYGLAKQAQVEKHYGKMAYYLCVSLIVPVFMHGFYDYCASLDSILRILMFVVFVLAMYIALFVRVHISSKKDLAFLKTQTTVYLTPDQASNYIYPNGNRPRVPEGARVPAPGIAAPGYPYGNPQGQPTTIPAPGYPYGTQPRPQGANPAAGPAAPNGMPANGPRPQGVNHAAPNGMPANGPRPQGVTPAAGPATPNGMPANGPRPQGVTPAAQNGMPVNGSMPRPETIGSAPQEPEYISPKPVVPIDAVTTPPGEDKPPIRLSNRASAYIFCRGCGNLCRANSFYCPSCGTLIHGTGPIQKKA